MSGNNEVKQVKQQLIQKNANLFLCYYNNHSLQKLHYLWFKEQNKILLSQASSGVPSVLLPICTQILSTQTLQIRLMSLEELQSSDYQLVFFSLNNAP